MQIWHLTGDAPRTPARPSPGEIVALEIGTWPIEEGQSVTVDVRVERKTGGRDGLRVDARWVENRGQNSRWRVELGPFALGDRVRYAIEGRSRQGVTTGPSSAFRVGPRLYVSLLWHQHQPIYTNLLQSSPRGRHLQPWVRMHALRDYHGMAWLLAERPNVHATINLTPSLLWQLEDLLAGGTDRAQELARKAPETLSSAERSELLARFFDADETHQIGLHPRYRELFAQRGAGLAFSDQDVRDLAAWFSLAWFAPEFRDGEVALVTGERASVQRFVAKGRGFSASDLDAIADEERKVMAAVIPLHRALQDAGQIEIATTPFHHPILPLLVDSDRAIIDRVGTSFPRRFAWPEDAAAHVTRAVEQYKRLFGRRPRGMWPAEGAVSQNVIPLFAAARLKWIATDRGVLARSGAHGYAADDPDVLCRPWRAVEGESDVAIFFRDTRLSDDVGFVFKTMEDPDAAAAQMLASIEDRFSSRLRADGDRVLTIALDGENAWSGYRDDGRPFLRALYRALDARSDLETVTFAEYLDGNDARSVPNHPKATLARVYELATASWIDEAGSLPGNDLGTWIGEDEENRAWDLLSDTRDFLAREGATPASAPAAFEALYAAEGSDWFWWFGDDQDSGRDADFDDLFRMHLTAVYRALGKEPPASLAAEIVPHGIVWTFSTPAAWARVGDVITVRTAGPGELRWSAGSEGGAVRTTPAGGAMGHIDFFHATVGPFGEGTSEVAFRFRADAGGEEQTGVVRILPKSDA